VNTVTKDSMKASGGTEVELHSFLTTALGKSKWSDSRPGRFTPDSHWVPELLPKLRRRDFFALLISEKMPTGQTARAIIIYAIYAMLAPEARDTEHFFIGKRLSACHRLSCSLRCVWSFWKPPFELHCYHVTMFSLFQLGY